MLKYHTFSTFQHTLQHSGPFSGPVSTSGYASLLLVLNTDNNNNNDRLTAFDPGQPG